MTYKFHPQLVLRAHWQPLEGSGVIVLGRIVVVLTALIWPTRILSFTGVGSLVLPTTRRIAIAVVISIIGKIAVLKRHLLFSIFQPPATQCLHCPPDEIFSTPKRDHVIDVFPSSCYRVDLGYRIKSTVSNSSGPSLRVRIWVQTKPLPNWRSRSAINPNSPLGYGSMGNSQPN